MIEVLLNYKFLFYFRNENQTRHFNQNSNANV